MSTFVLIHGGCHGAWCWYKVMPLLEKKGHTQVISMDTSHSPFFSAPDELTAYLAAL